MSVLADPNRREFLKAATLGTAGLVVGFYVPGGRRFAHAAEAPAAPAAPPLPQANAFLRIAPDDTVTVLLAQVTQAPSQPAKGVCQAQGAHVRARPHGWWWHIRRGHGGQVRFLNRFKRLGFGVHGSIDLKIQGFSDYPHR